MSKNLRFALYAAFLMGLLGWMTFWRLPGGGVLGWLVLFAPPGLALVGFIAGWKLAGRRPTQPQWVERIQSDASLSRSLIITSLVLLSAMWGWVLTRPSGTFSDQGGLVSSLVVLPVSIVLWIAGGPLGLTLALRARRRSKDSETALRTSHTSSILASVLVLLLGLAFVAKWLIQARSL